jgi:flagellar protein FliO/FliZ
MSPVAAYIVETLVTLLGVVVLAVVVLYGARRFGVGRPSGPLELIGRLPLDARRAVYLVRVGKLVYVVGASEGGLTRLGELDAAAVPQADWGPPSPRFGEILAKMARRETGGSSPPMPPPGNPSGHA